MASLRGGKNLYGPKTLIGPWVESGKRANVTPTNSISGFATSAVEQQLDTQKEPPLRFGRGLPAGENERYDWGNVSPGQARARRTLRDGYPGGASPPIGPDTNEFNATKCKLGGMEKDVLTSYKEEDAGVKPGSGPALATTTNSSQMKAQSLIRALPGAPLSYDALIEKLTAKGAASSAALKEQVPGDSGMMDFELFKTAVKGCGVDMLDQQLLQVFEFFDSTGTGVISLDGVFGS